MDMKKAVIVDIDGTLAKMKDRGPFEWHKVGQDELIEPIRDLVRLFESNGYEIIIFSGRDSVCREITRKWLLNNDVPYNLLYMRPEKNNEKDSTIKERMYRENILGNCDVRYVVDDRISVCRMWHSLGLTLLRVGDPDSNF